MEIKYVGSGTRYSRAVIHGSTAYLAGNVAKDPGPTAAEQARMILSQIDETLALCGTDKSRLLTATIVFADSMPGSVPAAGRGWDAAAALLRVRPRRDTGVGFWALATRTSWMSTRILRSVDARWRAVW